jgi:hypothetical protein
VGATDGARDFFPCGKHGTVRAQDVDIASATGLLTEDGTALAFTVTLRSPPPVPDKVGHPFRVDVLMRDPRLPDYSIGPYHDVNRILRFEATDPPSATMLLLPERGNVTPSTYGYKDGTVSFTVAGRLLGEEHGTQPFDPSPIRWSVITRDEDRCDRLGGQSPDLRLVREREAPRPGTPPASSPSEGGGLPGWTIVAVGVGIALLLGGGMFLLVRRGAVRR